MNEWLDDLTDETASGEACVLVTVAAIRGSAPREAGAKMVVTARATCGTIGGGQLEYQCTRIATEYLQGATRPAIRTFPLGASLGQCCGGVVEVLFEPVVDGLPAWLRELNALHGQRIPTIMCTNLEDGSKVLVTADESFAHEPANPVPSVVSRARELLAQGSPASIEDGWIFEPILGTDFNIAVFGAGHVGSAVVQALAALDCNIRWIDSRRRIFRNAPVNVRPVETPEPALEVAAMPPASCYLVMTHSHALDLEICERILRRDDFIYCGLIGSRSKRRRFEKRLIAGGLPAGALRRLTCPIGVDGISGKKPAEIAVAAAAEVLQAWEARARQRLEYPDNVRPLKG